MHWMLSKLGRKNMIAWCIIMLMFVVFLVILNIFGTGDWWDEMTIFGKTRNGNFCENIIWSNFFRQRANSWSNIFFILFGSLIILFYLCVKFKIGDCYKQFPCDRLFHNFPSWILIFGASEVYVGLTSLLYHASFKPVLQNLDIISIYCIMITLIGYIIFQYCYSYTLESVLAIGEISSNMNDNINVIDKVEMAENGGTLASKINLQTENKNNDANDSIVIKKKLNALNWISRITFWSVVVLNLTISILKGSDTISLNDLKIGRMVCYSGIIIAVSQSVLFRVV